MCLLALDTSCWSDLWLFNPSDGSTVFNAFLNLCTCLVSSNVRAVLLLLACLLACFVVVLLVFVVVWSWAAGPQLNNQNSNPGLPPKGAVVMSAHFTTSLGNSRLHVYSHMHCYSN